MSPARQEVLDALLELEREVDWLPSVREIAARAGKSPSVTHGHLRVLVATGYVSQVHRSASQVAFVSAA
jgi:DNA-binding IclR family transcriptional regulator